MIISRGLLLVSLLAFAPPTWGQSQGSGGQKTEIRSTALENRLKEEFQNHKELGHHPLKREWGRRNYCGIFLGHQNHGHWKNEEYEVMPDWNSLQVTISKHRAHLKAEITMQLRGNFHHIWWESGLRLAEIQIKPSASVKIVIDFDAARERKTHLGLVVLHREIRGGGLLQPLAELAFSYGELVAHLQISALEQKVNRVIETYFSGK